MAQLRGLVLTVILSGVVLAGHAAQSGQSAAKKAVPRPGAADKGKPATVSQLGGYSDEEITALIRKALQSDKSLSPAARKVTVSTLTGYVTLTGTVRNAAERSVIGAKAADIAGDNYIIDMMTVPKTVPKTTPKGTAKGSTQKAK
jgi:osmotically-inducible protein OsmY